MRLKLAFSLNRVWQHYEGKRFAIVSAYLMSSTPETNQARATALKAAVRTAGYGYVEMEGHWIETRGEHKGKELTEYPLFIPNATIDDAMYFGSGEYYPAEPAKQQAIIVGDGEKIVLLGSSETSSAWSVLTEFDSLQANLETALKRWTEKREKLSREEITSEEAEEEYMGWSSIKGRPWKLAHVTLSMIEPPVRGPAKSWGDSLRQAHWDDAAPHDYLPKTPVKYRGATYLPK